MEHARMGVVAALGAIYLVWGSTYLAIKVAVASIPPMLLGSLRFLLAGGLLYGWSAWQGRRPQSRTPAGRPASGGRRAWIAATVSGVLLLVGGNGAVTWAEQQVDSGVAALLVATVPLWMGLLGYVQGERLRPRAIAGLVAGFVGVALLVRPAPGSAPLLPSLVVVGGALAWAVGSLYARRAALPVNALRATSMQMLAGGAVFTVLGVVTGEVPRLAAAEITAEAVLAVAYLIAFGSILAFSAYTWLLRAATPAVVGTYAYVNPLVAVLLGAVVLTEPLTPTMALSSALIASGVALITTAGVARAGASWRWKAATPTVAARRVGRVPQVAARRDADVRQKAAAPTAP